MSAKNATQRKPIKTVKLGGTTVSIQKICKPPYKFLVALRRDGKRVKEKYLKAKGEAEALLQSWQIEASNHGSKHGTIGDAERAAVIFFRDSITKMVEPRPSLMECVTAYLASISSQLSPVTINELIDLRVQAAERKGVRERTLHDLVGTDGKHGRLGAFAGSFGDREAAGITPAEIDQWLNLKCQTGANRREVMVRLSALFQAGIKAGLIRLNPLKSLVFPTANPARAHILKVSECARLLAACPSRTLPALAVQLFAGLRKAETLRLSWEDLDFDQKIIKVVQRKGAKKREKTRYAPLLPALVAWLEGHRRNDGPIFPTGKGGAASDQSYRKDFEKARKSANLETWDENTLRHTFGSNRVADTSNLEQVKMEMGHTTSRTTSEHYVNAVKPKDAASFWNLRPLQGKKNAGVNAFSSGKAGERLLTGGVGPPNVPVLAFEADSEPGEAGAEPVKSP